MACVVCWGGGVVGNSFICMLVHNFFACISDMSTDFRYCYVAFGS